MSKVCLIVDCTMPALPTYDQILAAEDGITKIAALVNTWPPSGVKASFFAPAEMVATRIRLRMTEIGTHDNCEIGPSVTASLAGKTYAEQAAIINTAIQAIEACRLCRRPPPVVYGMLPHGCDATTHDVLGAKYCQENFDFSDSQMFNAGVSAADWLDFLKDALTLCNPLVIRLDSSISGNGEWLAALAEFINYAKSVSAEFVLAKDI